MELGVEKEGTDLPLDSHWLMTGYILTVDGLLLGVLLLLITACQFQAKLCLLTLVTQNY